MVNVTVFHDENVGKVECYLDDRLMGTAHEAPFALMLDEAAFWNTHL